MLPPAPFVACAFEPTEATALAAPDPGDPAPPADPTATPAPIRSPPVRAGEPPSTEEKSFGICQHNIMKIKAAPMTSKAVMFG